MRMIRIQSSILALLAAVLTGCNSRDAVQAAKPQATSAPVTVATVASRTMPVV